MILEEVSKYHKEWVNICRTFVGSLAEDIVQDMYLLLIHRNVTIELIKYEDTINKYYIYRMLRNLCIDHLRKRKIHMELDFDIIDTSNNEEEKALDRLYAKVDKYSEGFEWYDKILFEMYMYSGLSFRAISNGTDKKAKKISATKEYKDAATKLGSGLSVTSMFHTIKACKLELYEELQEDFDDFFNGDYEFIK